MANVYYKYPKTFHVGWSKPDVYGNDRVLDNLDHFIGKQVVISTKMDGENTSLYSDKMHARSIDSGPHPSRTWLKAFHAGFKYLIPEGVRIYGENMQAKHAIYYEHLPSYFFVFGIYNEANKCLSWDETKAWCEKLGLLTVPVLYEGVWSEEAFRSCFTGRTIINGVNCGEQEGMVCRVRDAFDYNDFTYNVAKFVRQGHVAGDAIHWSKTGYMPNKLA